MPTFTGIGDNYLVSSTPFPYNEDRNRPWYDPYMFDQYVKSSFFYNLVSYAINIGEVNAKTATFTERIRPRVQAEPLDFRGLNVPRQYFDSKNFSVSFESYGNGVQYHKWDTMIYQFARRAMANPQIINSGFPNDPDLLPIVQEDLSINVVETFDRIARNTILANALNRTYASDATGFHDLAAGDTFTPEIAKRMQLHASYQGRNPSNLMPCLVSPAATETVVNLPATDQYMRVREAMGDAELLNYVIGDYMNVTWASNRELILWNVGEVLASASITGALEPGDGAPDPETTLVDDMYRVGAAAATHYIQLSSISDPSTAETGFKVGDIVTLVRTRCTANGRMATQNGVVWNDYRNVEARVVAVDYDNNRISIEDPILNEHYSTAISTGLYGWVIKGRPIHCAIFFNAGLSDPGIAAVIAEPPQMYVIPPIDDRRARWAFTWDAYMGYRVVKPKNISIHFYAGPITRTSIENGLEEVNL